MSNCGVFFMLKGTFIMLFLAPFLSIFGQKTIEKGWEDIGIDKIEIISDQIFRIEAKSKDTRFINLRTEIEGENYENVVIDTAIKDKTLTITTGFTPYFNAANDKLAAHKVISIELYLEVPEGKELFVSSMLASFKAEGVFENIYTGLFRGNCELINYRGNAQLNTRHGNIEVYAQPSVKGLAKSQRGYIVLDLPITGNYLVEARSVNGDISLLKSPQ